MLFCSVCDVQRDHKTKLYHRFSNKKSVGLVMGFITPGVNYVFNKKRIGKNNKATNNSIHPNENRDFNKRYPHHLHMRDISDVHMLYQKILSILTNKDAKFKDNLSLLRSNIERYVILVHELEITVKIKNVFPLPKEEAMNLLKTIIKIQGRQLLHGVQKNMSSYETPPLEATFNKQLNLIDGGCILFNKYLNKQLTIELKNPDYYKNIYDNDYTRPDFFKTEEDVQNSILSDMLNSERIKLVDLPGEILVKILSASNNIDNIALTCKFFQRFVLTHKQFISYEFIVNKYVHRYKLGLDSNSGYTLPISDEHHHSNSHRLKVSEIESLKVQNDNYLGSSDFREDVNGNYSLTRYRDPDTLTVLSSHAFETPYLTYQIYKSLGVDHVIPPSAWPDLQEKYNDELAKLSDDTCGDVSRKVEKKEFIKLWNELPIDCPYLDVNNPEDIEYLKSEAYVDKLRVIVDLMISKTRFKNNIEDLFHLIVSLVVKIEENVVNGVEHSIIPPQLLKNYAAYYMLEQLIESDPSTMEDGDEVSNENLWGRLHFKSPSFYILLKSSANEELEDLLCPLFFGDHLKEDTNFWMGLKVRNEIELIEELINDQGTSPSTYILNMLAF